MVHTSMYVYVWDLAILEACPIIELVIVDLSVAAVFTEPASISQPWKFMDGALRVQVNNGYSTQTQAHSITYT